MIYVVVVVLAFALAAVSFLYGITVGEVDVKKVLNKMPPPPKNVYEVTKLEKK